MHFRLILPRELFRDSRAETPESPDSSDSDLENGLSPGVRVRIGSVAGAVSGYAFLDRCRRMRTGSHERTFERSAAIASEAIEYLWYSSELKN